MTNNNNLSIFDTSSLPSMLTDTMPADCGDRNERERHSLALNIEEEEPLELRASTSHSVENLNRRPKRRGDGAQRRNPSKKCRQKRRRIHSDTDLTKMR